MSARTKKTFVKIILTLFLAFAVTVGFFQFKVSEIRANWFNLNVSGKNYPITAINLGFPTNGLAALGRSITRQAFYDPDLLHQAISQIAKQADQPAKDLNVFVNGSTAGLDTQTHQGQVINQDQAFLAVADSLNHLQNSAETQLQTDYPTVSLNNAESTLADVRSILSSGPIILDHAGDKNTVSVSTIGGWIKTTPNGPNLEITFDHDAIVKYLSDLSAKYEQQAVDLDLEISAGEVSNFQTPKDGIIVDKVAALDKIMTVLQNRSNASASSSQIELTDNVVHAGVSDRAKQLGIKELIGTATTTFAGSTNNRIHNIKVGAEKLNGALILPGNQFSTINTLGPVDADHGFVQELVIKGPDTIPEYGGGLCQVSTTLFRAALNAGLPITERQNHSYRVSFYEKDGDGNKIGPGLDATIYEPHPDLKFKNDTANSILVTDEVVGKKITFNFYGTSDGRTSKIIGPTILKLIQPDQDPQVEVTQNLQSGQTKQVEFAIVGAQTTATYEITYPDGTVKKQVFNSYYHPVQPKYEVGQQPN